MTKANKDIQGLEGYKEALRAVGFRCTAPRLVVLDHLHRTTGPSSHAELADALEGQGFDRATLYRVLMDLTEAGLLTRTDLGDHTWRFELRSASGKSTHADDHPHFVCIDCGEISCLDGLTVKVSEKSTAPQAVRNKNVQIQVKGRCDDCA